MATTLAQSSTILDVVKHHGREFSDKTFAWWVERNGQPSSSLTYGEVLEKSAQLAVHLIETSQVKKQEAVVLVYPFGLDFFIAFLAVQRAGAIPVLVPPPRPTDLDKDLPAFRRVVEATGATLCLTTTTHYRATLLAGGVKRVKSVFLRSGASIDWPEKLTWCATDSLLTKTTLKSGDTRLDNILPTDVAFLQYTSGSTGNPKGVEISHENLLSNAVMIADYTGMTPSSLGVGWLPHFHDMGLIGSFFSIFTTGASAYFFSPLDFVRDPNLWLDVLSRYQASYAVCPNFSLELTARKFNGKTIDLSHLRAIIVGAEPIRRSVLQHFYDTFKAHGLRQDIYRPGYGMAEATLLITGNRGYAKTIHDLVDDSTGAVLCGGPAPGVTVCIVDTETEEDLTSTGREGEIWVASASVSKGYRQNDEATTATFGWSRPEYPGLAFLRTGDLGRMEVHPKLSHVGPQLMVTGRLKDILIVNGRNVNPGDMEELIWQEWPQDFKAGSVAVFELTREEEGVFVLCAEVRPASMKKGKKSRAEYEAQMDEMASLVLSSSGVMLDEVALVAPGQIPRTTSGKIQRKESGQRYGTDSLQLVAKTTDMRRRWVQNVRQVLVSLPNLPPDLLNTLDDDQVSSLSLLEAGCDSLMLVRVASRLSEHYGVKIDVTDLLTRPSLQGLAETVLQAKTASHDNFAVPEEDKTVQLRPTSNQERIYLHSLQSEHHSLQYHVPFSVDVCCQDLDLTRLQRAIAHVVAAHESLRSTFAISDMGEVVIEVQERLPADLIARVVAIDNEQTAEQYLLTWARRAVDLSTSPWECIILPLSPDKVRLGFKVHHLVFDGVSAALVVEQISRAYLSDDEANSLSVTQPQRRTSERITIDATDLWPAWRTLPLRCFQSLSQHTKDEDDDSLRVLLPATVANQVRSLAASMRQTTFTLLLALFGSYLAFETEQDDFLVACPLSMRQDEASASLVGFFVNTMLLQLQHATDKQATLSGVAERLLTQVFHYLTRPDYDFPALLAQVPQHLDAQSSSSAAHTSNQQVLSLWFNYHEYVSQAEVAQARNRSQELPMSPNRTTDWTVGALQPLHPGASKFPLGLEVYRQRQGELVCVWEWQGCTWSKQQVAHLAQGFLEYATVVVRRATLATSSQRDCLLRAAFEESSCLQSLHPAPQLEPPQTLVALFSRACRRHGEATALVDGENNTSWTYRQLEMLTDAVAQQLRARFNATQQPFYVGLALERGPHLVVAILAVLKAGGAYVPLDLSNPISRNSYILEKTRAKGLLIDGWTRSQFLTGLGDDVRLVDVQEEIKRATEGVETKRQAAAKAQADQPCYVLFTSGSTGQPKGCLMHHGQVTHSVLAHCAAVKPQERRGNHQTRTLQFARYTFDHSVLELFMTFHVGGRVVTAPQSDLLSDLPRVVAQSQASMLVLTPTVASLLPGPHQAPHLQKLVLSGEVTPAYLRRRWLSKSSKTELYNLYGTTEGGIHQFCTRMALDEPTSLVGRPLSGMRAVLLDEDDEVVPKGHVGHIWVKGPTLGGGYLGNEEQTQRFFRELQPDSREPPALYHRTGDLGRLDEQGEMHLHGRSDQQVKVRGQRVELEEIEDAMQRHLQSTDSKARLTSACVVHRSTSTSHQEVDDEKVLVAYVQLSSQESEASLPLAVEALRAYLMTQLPPYMLPTYYVPLPALPLTSSGKLNRRKLASSPWSQSMIVAVTSELTPSSAFSTASSAASSSSSASSAASCASSSRKEDDDNRSLTSDEESRKRTSSTQEVLLHTISSITGRRLDAHIGLVEQGITSLTAMRILAVLRSHHKLDARIADLLGANSTVASLAERFEKRTGGSSLGIASQTVQKEASPSSSSSEDPLTKFKADPTHAHDWFPVRSLQQSYLIGRRHGLDLAVPTQTMTEVVLASNVTPEAVSKAFEVLMARHAALRLVFDDQTMQQRVLSLEETGEFPLHYLDLSEETADDDDDASREACIEMLRRQRESIHFDPQSWPLFDVTLARLSSGNEAGYEMRLWIALDLLIIDAQSVQTLFREFEALLHHNDGDGDLEPAPTFRDYVVWHKNGAYDEALLQKARSYWQSRVAKLPPAPKLPERRKRVQRWEAAGGSESAAAAASNEDDEELQVHHLGHAFTSNDWQAVLQTCRTCEVLPSAVLMTLFTDALRLWSQEQTSSFTVNTTLFNRQYVHEKIDAVVGDFTEGLLFAAHAPAEETTSFLARCRATQTQLLEDVSHADYSSVEVLRDLQKHAPGTMMPVVFTCVLPPASQVISSPSRDAENEEEKMEAVIKEVPHRKTQTSQVSLDFQVFPSRDGRGLEFHLDYMNIFEEGVVDSFFAALVNSFEALAGKKSKSGDDNLATTWNEKGTFTYTPLEDLQARQWANDTDETGLYRRYLNLNVDDDEEEGILLTEGFVQMARSSPDALALDAVDGRMTYGQLNEAALRVAAAISSSDLSASKNPQMIAVLLDKSCLQVVAVLGVLLAGHAYVPCDTEAPEERIRAIAEGANARIVLTSTAEGDQRPWLDSYFDAVVNVDDSKSSQELKIRQAKASDTAYTIFTSGSTGKPKGVVVSHRAALNTIASVVKTMQIPRRASCLGLAKLSFDLSVYDVFGTLALGGTLVLADPNEGHNPEHWLQCLDRIDGGIQVWNTVPMMLQMLLELRENMAHREQLSVALSHFKAVLLSGDRIPPSMIDTLLTICPDAPVYSLGGATEAAIWSISHRITRQNVAALSIPYGRPLANQTMHVLRTTDLNREGESKQIATQPVPTWVPGDLFIAGMGLAKGYTDVEQTKRAFVIDASTGQRLYRTGDVARYRPDGLLDFLGRSDSQTKIRGHRIGLGEIATVAKSSTPGLADVAVDVVGEGTNVEIVAFVLPTEPLPKVASWNEEIGLLEEVALRKAHQVSLLESPRQFVGTAKENITPDTQQTRMCTLRQSHYRFDEGASPITHSLLDELVQKSLTVKKDMTQLDREALQHALAALVPIMTDDGRLKYRYPSAGATYSVHCFVVVGEQAAAQLRLTPGVYALDALQSRLCATTASIDKQGLSLLFWADMAAIAPLYGDRSDEFVRLETGYMIGAVNKEMQTLGLSFQVTATREDVSFSSLESTLRPHLTVHDQLLCVAQVVDSAAEPSLHVSAFVKGRPGQWWQFFKGEESTEEEGAVVDYDADGVFFLANAALLHGATTFLVIEASSPYQAAAFAQSLLEEATELSLGFTHVPHISSAFSATLSQRGKQSEGVTVSRLLLAGGKVPSSTTLQQASASSQATHLASYSSLSRLNANLALHLPPYMLVGSLVVLESIPLTANGKVDRKKMLAAHAAQRLSRVGVDSQNDEGAALEAREPPATEMEMLLAVLWAELLSLSVFKEDQADRRAVHRHASFFDLGGHSLLAIKLQNRLQTVLGLRLSLRLLFDNPVLSSLAQNLEATGVVVDPTWRQKLNEGGQEADERQAPRRYEEEEGEGAAIVATAAGVATEQANDAFALTPIQEAYLIGRSPDVELGGVSTHGYQEFEAPFSLTPARLSAIINLLVMRHDALRLVFFTDETNGQLKQRVLTVQEAGVYEVGHVDVSEESQDVGEAMAEAVRQELSHQVLEPSQWPLFDVRMTKTAQRTVLHLSIDALIVDFYSSAILVHEALQLAAALDENPALLSPDAILPPLATTFRQIVLSQHGKLEEEDEHAQYWKQRAATFPLSLDLPLAKRPEQIHGPVFARIQAEVAKEDFEKLKTKAGQHGVMTASVIAAAFAKALSRHTQTRHFAVNLTVFQRPPDWVDVDAIIGDFTSSLLLEYQDEEGNFTQQLSTLNTQLLEDLSHARFSGVDMIRHLRSLRGSREKVQFPVVMTSVLHDVGASASLAHMKSLLGKPTYSISQTPQVWLDFQALRETEGQLLLRWDYVEALFSPGLIPQMHALFVGIVRDLCRDDWSSTTYDVRRRVPQLIPNAFSARAQANATAFKWDEQTAPQRLHEGFLRSLQRTPDKVCLIDANDDDLHMTYGELASAAQRIRNDLVQQNNIQQGEKVAVMVAKGWRQSAALLAILSLGCAYVPIEVDTPLNRACLILQQADCRVLLTSSSAVRDHLLTQLHQLPDQFAPILLDDVCLSHQQEETISLADGLQNIHPDHTAYLIFTSGSSGVPKGVVISHGAAMNTINDMVRRWSLGPADALFAISKLNFDLSVFDIFGAFVVGGTMVIPQDGDKDPAEWARLVVQYRVTVWNSVPLIVKMLLEVEQVKLQEVFATLRLLLMSGDWIPVALARELLSWQRRQPALQLISLGGATEAAIWSIFHPIVAEDVDEEATSIPYGRPLANQQMHVFHHRQGDGQADLHEPCPTFTVGRLFISGDGLAKGYLDPAKTAAAFVRHPVSNIRMYDTGDLARYLPSGELEFLGRSDQQVKVRGHRIELAEIAHHLQRVEGVDECAVEVVDGRLVGFVVVKEGTAPSVDKVNEEISLWLPTYMHVSLVVTLLLLPLSANGKLDRKALQNEAREHADSHAQRILQDNRKPTSELEIIVASLWAKVLNVPQDTLRLGSDFFTLGGDSLSAIRIQHLVKQHFSIEINLRTIFYEPNLEALCMAITTAQSQKQI